MLGLSRTLLSSTRTLGCAGTSRCWTEVFSSEMKFRVRAGRKKYLDVWPVDFLTSVETDKTDNTSLFLFQFACIVNMLPKWKKHTLTVFMCTKAADTNVASKEKELQQLLEVLMIKAETFVQVWDHLASFLDTGEMAKDTEQFSLFSTAEMMQSSASGRSPFLRLTIPPSSLWTW